MVGRLLRGLQLAATLAVGVLVVDDARAAGAWETVAELKVGRWDHTATILEDGRVLLVAGRRPSTMATVELFDPLSQTSELVEQLSEARAEHTATLLDDGRVLVAGGTYDQPDDLLDSVEIYDPVLGTWSPAAPMSSARAAHAAVRLLDGRVLVSGGRGDQFINPSAEIYDPVLDSWSSAGLMNDARENHQATLLPDGRVLVTGGNQEGEVPVAPAEIFDPDAEAFLGIGALAYPRYDHGIAWLPDGRLLIAGGKGEGGDNDTLVAAAELFDPAAPVFSPAPSMNSGHSDSRAVALLDGRVLMVASHSEVFDPAKLNEQPWKYAGVMQKGRKNFVAVLTDGRAFVFGGNSGDDTIKGIEVWDPEGVDVGPLGFPCSGADECESGFCADGVCCDTACDRGSCDRCTYENIDHNGTCSVWSCAGYAYVLEENSCGTEKPACKTSCMSTADCNRGFVCDPATAHCEEEGLATGGGTPPEPDEGGEPPDNCSCSLVGTRGRGWWLSAAALPVLALRRRRRSKRGEPSLITPTG